MTFLQSMTGYGRSRVCRDGRELTLEIKTVNHRFLDVSIRLPKSLLFLEDTLRTRLNQSELVRGHADVFVTYANTRTDARNVSIDKALLQAFNKALRSVKEELSDYRRPSVPEALSLSGAFSVSQAEEDADELTAMAQEAFDAAIVSLVEMRAKEGESLRQDLQQNLDALSALRAQIVERAPAIPQEYRRRLQERMEEWQLGDADPQRIAQEVAIMADRCAIDEELSRLQSHIDQFGTGINAQTEIGRKLDFLLQEMNREVNTIGSKANDADITQLVVDAKCIIEKLREQVQNAV